MLALLLLLAAFPLTAWWVRIRRPRSGSATLLYDGECGMCDRFVRFVLARDSAAHFRFAPLQSAHGRELLRAAQRDPDDLSTMVLFQNGRSFVRSTAALEALRQLDGLWPAAFVLRLIPAPLRDGVYTTVARYRHRLFPPPPACPMLPPAWRERFIA